MRRIKVMIVATAPVNCDHFVVDIEVIVVLTVKGIFIALLHLYTAPETRFSGEIKSAGMLF